MTKTTKTTEQRTAEYITLLEQNGFAPNGETFRNGSPVYARRWSKQVEVLWHGEMETSLEIRAAATAWGSPIIFIYRNGRQEGHREHTSPKRSINAIREIVRFAGFAF